MQHKVLRFKEEPLLVQSELGGYFTLEEFTVKCEV